MNWVGGKLQRHAKANANDQKRAQKQYFAKARQRLQYGQPPVSPPALAHFHASNQHPSSQNPLEATHRTRPVENISTNPRVPRPRAQEEPAPISANPLECVKRRLLGKDDWAGLSAARPVQMSFPRPAEMHRIGRQKKVQKKQHPKAMRNENHQGRLLQALAAGRSRPVGLGLRENDCSIRIGSNLHQTQITARTDPEPAFPSDPMLLDSKNKHTQCKAPATEELYLQQDQPQEDHQENLLPLQQIRNLSSFDDVKDRSSSMIRHASDSSNPFLANHGPEQSISQSKPEALKIGGVRSKQDDQVSRRGKQPVSAHPLKEHTLENKVADREKETTNGGTHLSTHRFTIDHQVLLERQLLSSTTTLPSSRSHSVSLPPLPEESFAIDSGQQTSLQSSYFDSLQYQSPEKDDISQNKPPAKRRRLLGSSNMDRVTTESARGRSAQSGSPGAGKSTPLNMRDRFGQAKRDHERGSHSPGRGALPSRNGMNVANNLSDENEAWMKYVFPDDFGRIRNNFTFQAPPLKQSKSYVAQQSPVPSLLPSRGFAEPAQMSSPSAASVPTDVNASMPVQDSYLLDGQQTETDFLSRISPMEGILEEGLGPLSTYTNVARTDRSFISAPTAPVMPARGSVIYSPVDPAASRTPTYRKILHPLSQPRLWQNQSLTGPVTPAKEAIWSATLTRTSGTGVEGLALPAAQQLVTPSALHGPALRSIDDWSTINAIAGSINPSSNHDRAFAAPASQPRRFVRPAM